MIHDGAVLREVLDRFWKQKRYQAIPDFVEHLLDDELNRLRKDEWDLECARIEMGFKKKGKKK